MPGGLLPNWCPPRITEYLPLCPPLYQSPTLRTYIRPRPRHHPPRSPPTSPSVRLPAPRPGRSPSALDSPLIPPPQPAARPRASLSLRATRLRTISTRHVRALQVQFIQSTVAIRSTWAITGRCGDYEGYLGWSFVRVNCGLRSASPQSFAGYSSHSCGGTYVHPASARRGLVAERMALHVFVCIIDVARVHDHRTQTKDEEKSLAHRTVPELQLTQHRFRADF